MVSKSCLKAVLHSRIIVKHRNPKWERVIGVATTEGGGSLVLPLKTVQGQPRFVAGINPTKQRTRLAAVRHEVLRKTQREACVQNSKSAEQNWKPSFCPLK